MENGEWKDGELEDGGVVLMAGVVVEVEVVGKVVSWWVIR